jgi:Uncharacterized protein conserved in bacteria
MKYVALLRGINVGKSVKVPMKQLKSIIEKIGYTNVVTYLNSGNVIFDSSDDKDKIRKKIEIKLEEEFGQYIPTLVKTSKEMMKIKNSIPDEWQNDTTQQTYVAYLFNEVANPKLIMELPIKHEYIDIRYVDESLIWNIKREYYNKSQITKIANHYSYDKMTTRNVNTARKLAELSKE